MAVRPEVSGQVLGLGLDLVDIDRFRAVLARRPALAGRVFTDAERWLADDMINPLPTLAGRFAVKEAVMKALGVGIGAVSWKEIGAARQPSGAPLLEVTGRAAELAAQQGIRTWRMSITHTDTVAAAVVLALS